MMTLMMTVSMLMRVTMRMSMMMGMRMTKIHLLPSDVELERLAAVS